MKIRQRMAERRLTNRDLAAEAGVSTATVYNAKKGKVSRWKPMELMAAALDCEVEDIDEFRPVLRERILREAERQGAPTEVLDQADQVFEIGILPSQEAVQLEAYSLMKDVIAYLDSAGRRVLVDKAIQEREEANNDDMT